MVPLLMLFSTAGFLMLAGVLVNQGTRFFSASMDAMERAVQEPVLRSHTGCSGGQQWT